jgi:[acyl-carrier-protein] S-malonyltransferase
MQPAADGLRAALAGAALAPARFPVYANESARPVRTPAEVRESLYRQLTSPVLWERTIRNLAEAGATEFLEAGPGTSLSNLVKRILPEARVWNAGTWAEAGAFAGSRCAVDGKPGG